MQPVIPPSLPLYYNFLHAIELGLKSYIRQVDAVSMEDLRKKFSHKISPLLRVAIEHDLRSHCRSLKESQITALHEISWLYSDKQFEYFRLRLFEVVTINPIAEAADAILDGIGSLPLRLAQDPNARD